MPLLRKTWHPLPQAQFTSTDNPVLLWGCRQGSAWIGPHSPPNVNTFLFLLILKVICAHHFFLKSPSKNAKDTKKVKNHSEPEWTYNWPREAGSSWKQSEKGINFMEILPITWISANVSCVAAYIRTWTQKYTAACETTLCFSWTPSASVIINSLHHFQGLWHRMGTWLGFGVLFWFLTLQCHNKHSSYCSAFLSD